ncbi:hypothetical protein ACSSS7_003138 [Eimeria intestinalis]
MSGEPPHFSHGRVREAPPGNRNIQSEVLNFGVSSRRLRRGRSLNVASALVALIAVAAVAFLIWRCTVWRVLTVKTSGLAARLLASGDEEDGSKIFSHGSPKVCEGTSEVEEQQVPEAQASDSRSKRRRVPRVPSTAAYAGESPKPSKRIRSVGREATMEFLMKMHKDPAKLSAQSKASEEIGASTSSPCSAEASSHPPEGQPSEEKKRSEESPQGEAHTAEGKTGISGEPSTSSGRPYDENDEELPSSLLDSYLEDTLEAAQASFFADWLLDPDQDIPQSPAPPEQGGDLLAPEDLVAKAPGSLGDPSHLVEEAPAIVRAYSQQKDSRQILIKDAPPTSAPPGWTASFPLKELLQKPAIVGPSMRHEEWWESFTQTLLMPPEKWKPKDKAKTQRRGIPALTKKVVEAMAILRTGQRVPAHLIVQIMQKLLCSETVRQEFRGLEWDGWRQADREFSRESGEGSSSKDSVEDA